MNTQFKKAKMTFEEKVLKYIGVELQKQENSKKHKIISIKEPKNTFIQAGKIVHVKSKNEDMILIEIYGENIWVPTWAALKIKNQNYFIVRFNEWTLNKIRNSFGTEHEDDIAEFKLWEKETLLINLLNEYEFDTF